MNEQQRLMNEQEILEQIIATSRNSKTELEDLIKNYELFSTEITLIRDYNQKLESYRNNKEEYSRQLKSNESSYNNYVGIAGIFSGILGLSVCYWTSKTVIGFLGGGFFGFTLGGLLEIKYGILAKKGGVPSLPYEGSPKQFKDLTNEFRESWIKMHESVDCQIHLYKHI